MRLKLGVLVVSLAMLGAVLVWYLDLREKSLFAVLDPGPFRAVYLVEDTDTAQTRIDLIFPSGEVDHVGPEGLAHYVEHLAWLNAFGAKTQTNSKLRHSNAWTSRFATGYFLTGTKPDLPDMLTRLAALSAPIELDQADMERERQVVLQELSERTNERPALALWMKIENALYGGPQLARQPVGHADTIALYTSDLALQLHENTHILDQATLIAYGPFERNSFATEIASLCPCERGDFKPKKPPLLPNTPVRNEADLYDLGLTSDRLAIAILAEFPEDFPSAKANAAVDFLNALLNSNQEGGLAGPLRLKQFLAREFWVNVTYHPSHAVELRFQASPDAGVSIVELQNAFEHALDQLAQDGPPMATFDQLMDRRISVFEKQSLASPNTAGYLRQTVSNRQVPISHGAFLEILTDLTRSDIATLLGQLTQNSRVVIRRVWPNKDT